MKPEIELYDTTLRDGSQGEGINFSALDKLRIAEKLDSFGIHYIEGGWPGSNPKDMEFFSQAARRKWKHALIAAFSMTRRKATAVENDELMRQILGDMRALLMLEPGDLRVRRLYPSAYADDAEKEDEYRMLTHEELRSSRLANVDAVEASIDAKVLNEEQLTAWMQAINSLRLVLGTLLDINDDDQELSFDPDDPEARTQALYGYLGGLLDEIVDAQLEVL